MTGTCFATRRACDIMLTRRWDMPSKIRAANIRTALTPFRRQRCLAHTTMAVCASVIPGKQFRRCRASVLSRTERQTGGLVEISRLSIEPVISNTSYRTTLYAFLVRAFTAAKAAGVSMILIATKPDWVRFYQYMLGFHPIGLPALYPPGDFKITLLGGNLEQAQCRQRIQNRFFKITDEEVASMKDAIAAGANVVDRQQDRALVR